MKKCLDTGELKQIDICFYNQVSQPIEKLVIKLDAFDRSGDV